MRRSSALLVWAVACARTSAPPAAPVPAAVEPSGAYLGQETAVVLHGEGFTPAVVQRLNGGGHIEVDAAFRAFLGTTGLNDVRFIDSSTLTAVVPADLALGTYGLSVEGPYGRGTVDGVFRVWQGPPAALSASSSPPTSALAGVEFTVVQTVSNSGGMTALGVGAGSPIVSGPNASVAAPTEIVDIPAGGSHPFTWRILATDAGQLQIELPVQGADEVDGSALVATTDATVNVSAGPQLQATPQAAPASAPVGALIELAADVVNSGGTDALGVHLDDPAGAANVGVVSSPAPQTVPAGQTRTFRWTVQGTAAGSATLGSSGQGTDPLGGPLPIAPFQWQPIAIQPAGGLGAVLAVPPGVLPGETFTLTLTVTNPSASTALGVQPALALSGSAASSATMLTFPGTADIPAGQSVAFTWTYQAGGSGTLDVEASAAGTDSGSGAWLAATASGSTQVSDAAFVSQDPFADASKFSYVFAYAGRVYLGPSANGTRAVRMKPDGTSPETVQFAFQTDPAGVQNSVSPRPSAFPSLGYLGCTPDTLQCGPDDEDGRGLFTAFTSAGREYLFAGGGRQSSVIKHAYVTSDTSASPPFSFIDANLGGGMRGATAAALLGSTLWVGLANGGGSGSPGIVPISSPYGAGSMGIAVFPGALVNQTGTAFIDSMATYNGVLYAANDGGCARYDGVTSWTSCTPSAAAWSLTPVSTSKVTDFVPADKAVPQMTVSGNSLFLARNTTVGPQIWVCSSTLFVCGSVSGPWSLFAANGTGNAQLSQFNDGTLARITLLVATSQHLYVGYDAAAGIRIYRSSNPNPSGISDFTPWATPGLGDGLTHILDGQALTFAGKDYLYVTARADTGAVRVYRLAQ